MRRRGALVALIVFLIVILGVGGSIVYLASSTAGQPGGTTSVLGAAGKATPFYGQAGWLRNTSPWPIQITAIELHSTGTVKSPEIFVAKKLPASERESDSISPGNDSNVDSPPQSDDQPSLDTPDATDNAAPKWAKTPITLPYTLQGGAIRYFGFAVTPKPLSVGTFDSVTVRWKGVLGLPFHRTFSGFSVAASGSKLPVDVLSDNPTSDTDALNTYVALLRIGLADRDPNALALVMGDGVTAAQATALKTTLRGYTSAYRLATTRSVDDSNKYTFVFYRSDPTKDALPSLHVVWANYRWSIVPAK